LGRTPQTDQLPPGLGLIRHDLENARVFLSGFEAVARLRLGTGKAQPSLDVAGIPGQHRPPFVHRLEVLLGLPEALGEPEAKRPPGTIEGHRAPILLERPGPLHIAVERQPSAEVPLRLRHTRLHVSMSWWGCFAKVGCKFEKQHVLLLFALRRSQEQALPD